MQIRPADVEDAAAIAVVHTRSWRAVYRGLISQDYLDSIDVSRREAGWRRMLTAIEWPRAGVVVAEVDGAVVGFATFGASRDEDAAPSVGELSSIYVLPSEWGKGIGHALLDEACARLASVLYRRATLWVLAGNERAMNFYTAGGWRPDGTTKRDEFDGVHVDEIRLARGLRAIA